jgi:hypothetical protein
MANNVVHNITSLEEFIRYINDEYEYLTIYRGQSEDKPLIPKLGRIDLKSELLESERNMLDIFKEQSIPFLPRVPNLQGIGLLWPSITDFQHDCLIGRSTP